ncbi:RagB/SusD family nutrient uptake outer membrane protein [Wocania ichthyoenteri]|uniref:RagB/SusD family nutrient uptake outer membrane protein n=1 Tax=Wocania ichthyoenteri TaxID=1230531 RepID=UPI00053DFF5A|nr:RagB/SusD family nutrient uptake outer membrane protein [Wocania ichthyoenteri]
MKNNIYIGLILIASIFTSCEKDYLDVVPDNVATIDNAFSNRYNAQKFLVTIYSAIPSPGSVNNPALNAGDEIWYPTALQNRTGVRIAQGFQNATNPYDDKWTGSSVRDLYVGIRNCNIFLNKIEDVLGMDAYEKRVWIAEVNFLKAYFHFYLFKMYGPIVISDEAVEVGDTNLNLKPVRKPVDEVVPYIIDLMDKAIADLPLTLQFESLDLGRITKPIAAAIKARVLMTYASPLFNGNSVYQDFLNAEGEPLFPLTYSAEKWQMAATACKEAIDICHEAGLRLYKKSDYINPFPQSDVTLLTAALRGRVTEPWNPELIWGHTDYTGSIQSESMTKLYAYTIGYVVAARHAPTLRIAETYYSKNGVPINEDVTYDYNNRYNLRQALTTEKYQIEPGQETAVLNFDRETRFYSDLSFDRATWFGNGREDSDDNPWYIRARLGEFASVADISGYSVTGYWPKKLVNIKTVVQDGRTFGVKRYPFPIIRLADLYLYYAEALNEFNGPTSDVYTYIDLVRERAGLDGVVSSWQNFSSNPGKPLVKDGMRSIIQQERMIEMAFEGGRFWDLRRWKLAKNYMNGLIKGWNVLENSATNYYTVKTIFNTSFTERDYLWPIPESEIINTPSIIQNPGW